MIRYLIIFLYLLIVSGLEAQQLRLLDQQSQLPIDYASLSSGGRYLGTTDAEGYYRFEQLPDSLCIDHIAYGDTCIHWPEGLTDHSLYLSSGIDLSAITIQAHTLRRSARDLAQHTVTIDPRFSTSVHHSSSADLIEEVPGVQIQKSQQGGGSPMIRGFAANRIVLVVDGIRLNNAIYRSGNLQNILSVDPWSLGSVDVILGAHSLSYGSDALGGVIHMRSHEPSTDDISLRGALQYYSAAHEWTGHIGLSARRGQWNYRGDLSYSQYGDLRMGSHGPERYLRDSIPIGLGVQRRIVASEDPRIQAPGGYDAFSTRHIIQRQIPGGHVEYGYYLSGSSDIPRYDRLTQPAADGSLRSIEWYYGPQRWTMHRLGLQANDLGALADKLNIQLAYQRYEESRHDRRRDSDILRSRSEAVDIYNIQADITRSISDRWRLHYGLEGIINYVHSMGQRRNIISGMEDAISSRYPDGSRWYTAGFYIQTGLLVTESLGLNGGLRYTRSGIRGRADAEYYPLPDPELNSDRGALSGALSLNYRLTPEWMTSLTLSTGFRAPNIDDVAKVFDSEPGTVLLPNPGLGAEHVYTVEASVERSQRDGWSLAAHVYYSYIDDIMTRAPDSYQGRDSILYDGVLSRVLSLQNASQGIIYGSELAIDIPIHTYLSFSSSLSYQQGRQRFMGIDEAIRHVAPMRWRGSISYERKRVSVFSNLQWNGSRAYEDLALSERAKTHIYDLDAQGRPYSPSWYRWDIGCGYRWDRVQLRLGIDNLLDRRYRAYSSGISGPGRSVMIRLQYSK